MSILDNIKITLPKKTIELNYLLKILELCNNVKVFNSTLIQATSSKELKPTITFDIKAAEDPSLSFTGSGLGYERFDVAKLPIGFNLGELDKKISGKKENVKPLVTKMSDAIGEYLQVQWPFATYNQLNFKQLHNRLVGKVVSLDHVGININPRLLSKDKYKRMKNMVAGSSYLSDYPFNKEWPFIIPASFDEQKQGIEVSKKRDPKFEFVYDFKYAYPEIQFDIQTKLSPKETIGLFPAPYGYYDPNPETGDYCSSVFIFTGWQNVSLRMDIRFYIPKFNHTDWLINKKLRVK